MPPNMIGMLIPAIAFIVIITVAVGLPALAIVVIRYFKLKERELALEMEFRRSAQEQGLALEQRVQRLEDALTSLDHDVREHLGIGKSATPLQPDLLEAPATADERRGSPDPAWRKAR